MYVVTFYSFKGGTGRSMALANVAADLLNRGRRVLIVDFDLEAPGLDTYPMVLERPIERGVVEMITDYLKSDEGGIPSIREYVYEAKLEGVDRGRLWIMPAGCQDSSYDGRFKSIDWPDLYSNQEGFLFFEDLKAQWNQVFSPDYVLIDSRTGHTDVGGICTRQLPDSVVAMFFPNEQNLRGLAPIVKDIQLEEDGPLRKRIDLHFVMGNLPDLSDEEELLSDALRISQKTLKYKKLSATIHHFNSLMLLKQRLMIVDRPKSKIAVEYQQLTSALVEMNLADRDGAISALKRALTATRTDKDVDSDSTLEERLQKILLLHSTDLEILRRVARLRRAQGRTEESLELFDRVLQIYANDSSSLVGRAEILLGIGKIADALKDLEHFFSQDNTRGPSFVFAVRLLISTDTNSLSTMLDSPAVPELNFGTLLEVMNVLLRNHKTAGDSVVLLKRWGGKDSSSKRRKRVSHSLSLCLIAAGRFDEAVQEIVQHGEDRDAVGVFNCAMAEWGLRRKPPVAMFNTFLEIVGPYSSDPGVNVLQCLAIAHWATGELDKALELIDQAKAQLVSAPISTFSGWSYLYLPPRLFIEELSSMRVAFLENSSLPNYIRPLDSLFS